MESCNKFTKIVTFAFVLTIVVNNAIAKDMKELKENPWEKKVADCTKKCKHEDFKCAVDCIRAALTDQKINAKTVKPAMHEPLTITYCFFGCVDSGTCPKPGVECYENCAEICDYKSFAKINRRKEKFDKEHKDEHKDKHTDKGKHKDEGNKA